MVKKKKKKVKGRVERTFRAEGKSKSKGQERQLTQEWKLFPSVDNR